MSEELDFLIKNASIVDGSGAPSYPGSVGIRGDRIAAIVEGEGGRLDAREIVDARGLTAIPGIIDVHNHADLSILYYPEAESFLRQGITTFVGGLCGDTPGPYNDEYVGEPWFLWDIYDDLSSYMYYRDWLLPRDAVNARHEEVYGWGIDWSTMGEFFKRVEERGLSPNYVPQVGHGDIRSMVMGPDFKREATKAEVREMAEHVEAAMEEGCRGLSVGRDYEPGFYAEIEELVSCAEVAARYGGVYSSHCLFMGPPRVRKPTERPPPRLDGVLEAIEVGKRAKISVQISHISPLYPTGPGESEIMKEASVKATFKVIEDARAEGIDVNYDVIPNHETGGIFTSSWLVWLLAPWMRVSGTRERLAENLRMKEFRSEIKETIMAGKWNMLNPNLFKEWSSQRYVVSCSNEEFVGKNIKEVSEALEIDDVDALLEIIAQDPYTKTVRRVKDESTKLMLFAHPEGMIGVDTFATDDKYELRSPPWMLPNENGYGGFPRYFRRMVRETKMLTLEEAVRKVTSLPARKFKLRDRGLLKSGAFADITIMDPSTIADQGDQLNPRRYPKGIEYVFVNGRMVVNKEGHTGDKPGKILYRE